MGVFLNIFRGKASAKGDANAAGTACLVDERFELVSLAFRLAGRAPYADTADGYQKALDARFGAYREHPAVAYARRNLNFGYDAVFSMAIHLEKTGGAFALVGNTGFLLSCRRWTKDSAGGFVALLNDFYADAGFAGFFQENAGLYMKRSERFRRDVLRRFNFGWFAAHGANPGNLRVVLSPTSGNYGGAVYGATPRDNIVYAALRCAKRYGKSAASTLAHEFAHSFANPIAQAWYGQDAKFRKLCDDSVDAGNLPFYANGMVMAFEYVTRAYDALYMAENFGGAAGRYLRAHKKRGFKHIEEVYALVAKGYKFSRDECYVR